MVFSTWDEMNKFYRGYGRQEGFGVVCIGGGKPSSKNAGKSTSYRTYVWKCECYGKVTYRRKVNGKRVLVKEEPVVKKKT